MADLDAPKPKVLLVDDEPAICKLLALQLREEYDVTTAVSGAEGMRKLASGGPFAAVISDYEMPEMDGPTFLNMVQQKSPDSIRLMLTGNRHFEVAIEAINTGAVFRFITKPCNAHKLAPALADAVEQYKLRTAERDLLNKTLDGSVNLLIDVVSIVSPLTFGTASAAAGVVRDICDAMKSKNGWEIRLAAMLSQIGCIALGKELAEKIASGAPLDESERELCEGHPEIGNNLVARIPRLQGVANIIARQRLDYESTREFRDEEWFSGASVLRVALDYVQLTGAGKTGAEALKEMRMNGEAYDPLVLATLQSVRESRERSVVAKRMVCDLKEGMTLASDVLDARGQLLITKGRELSGFLLERIRSFARGSRGVQEPISVFETPEEDETAANDNVDVICEDAFASV
ncbi:MAG: response regulator [Aureliella sp.]